MAFNAFKINAAKERTQKEPESIGNQFCAMCVNWFRKVEYGRCGLSGDSTRFDEWCSSYRRQGRS
jgi:hypothetical protein